MFLPVMYQRAPIFAEETESSKKPNASRISSGVFFYSALVSMGALGKLQILWLKESLKRSESLSDTNS